MDPATAGNNLPPNAQESIVGSLIAYCVICLFIIAVPVSLRFYIRLEVIRKFGTDDMALAATVLSTVGGVIVVIYATRLGLGTHLDMHSVEERSALLKLLFMSALGYHLSIMLLKTTFLLQFRRVFPLPAFQRLCDIFLAFLAVWAVAGTVAGALICLPVSQNWDPYEPIWICEKRLWFWTGHGIVHIITDFLIFVMPLPLLKTLPLPPLHKIVLIAIFCLGFVTCVISVLRLPTMRASLTDPDVSWTSAKTVFWSLGEVTCSSVCLCIPTLRPLVGTCCSRRRLGDGNIGERGTRRFGFYAISLPSTVGAPSPTRPAGTAVPSSISNNQAG